MSGIWVCLSFVGENEIMKESGDSHEQGLQITMGLILDCCNTKYNQKVGQCTQNTVLPYLNCECVIRNIRFFNYL